MYQSVCGTSCAEPAPARRFTAESAVTPTLTRLDTDQDGKVEAEEYERVRFYGRPFPEVDTDSDGALGAAELLAVYHSQSPTSFFFPPVVAAGAGPGAEAGPLQRLPGPGLGATPDGHGEATAPTRGARASRDGGTSTMGGPGSASGPRMGGPMRGGPGEAGPGMAGPGMAGPGMAGPGMAGPGPGAGEPGAPVAGRRGVVPTEETGRPRPLRETGAAAQARTVQRVLDTLEAENLARSPTAPTLDPALREAAIQSGDLGSEAGRAALAELERTATSSGLDFPASLRQYPPALP